MHNKETVADMERILAWKDRFVAEERAACVRLALQWVNSTAGKQRPLAEYMLENREVKSPVKPQLSALDNLPSIRKAMDQARKIGGKSLLVDIDCLQILFARGDQQEPGAPGRRRLAAAAMPALLAHLAKSAYPGDGLKATSVEEVARASVKLADKIIELTAPPDAATADTSEMAQTITKMTKAIKHATEDHQCAHICDGPHADCPCWYCECGRALQPS